MQYGRYQIIKELGRGSMGVVYQAHDPQIDRLLALKVLRPDRMGSADFVQRFMKEAKAIGRMAHPGIVTVYDVGEDQETVYIAMEFLEGVPLSTYAKECSLSSNELASIGIQVAESLDYAHARGIVHRDIKPQNIMITPDARVKITDFGIAHIEDPAAAQQTQAGEILGTPNYMSPEQVLGRKVDGRSDLYSLGVILYELSCGVRPFRGENLGAVFHAITSETPPPPATLNPEIDPDFSRIIMQCLRKEPEARFQSGKALAEALTSLGGKQDTAPVGTPRKSKTPRGPIIAGAVLLLAIVLGAVYFMTNHPPEKKAVPPPAAVVPQIESFSTGALQVESTPTGAQVFIDGAFQGTTPLRLDLSAGAHEVRLSMPDHHEWEAQVQVEKQQTQPLNVTLEPVVSKE